MNISSKKVAAINAARSNSLGQRIRKARKGLGLTQEALASPRFTKAYVSALERGRVRPSLKALEFLAERLSMQASELLSAEADVAAGEGVGLLALEEDLNYQVNYAKMLMRTNHVQEALELLEEAERSVQHAWDKLPARAQ